MKLRLPLIAAPLLFSGVLLAQESQYKLFVDGLACPFCAFGIEKQLRATEGVTDVETQIEEGAVVVTVEEGAMLSEERANQAVEDAGFTLKQFEEIEP